MSICCNQEKTWDILNRELSVGQLMERQNELNNFLFDGVQGAWATNLTKDHYLTAILDEMSEFLGSNVTWKWWSNPKNPATFDSFNAKIEMTDIVFFYVSIMTMKAYGDNTPCRTTMTFSDYEDYYVGADRGPHTSGVGLLTGVNCLTHTNFIGMFKAMCEEHDSVFDMIEVLDRIVSGGGMSSELMSALYVSKWVLNSYRWEFSDYEKTVNGVEDNTRLEPYVDAFLDDKDMTLEMLKQNVINEFFDIPTIT